MPNHTDTFRNYKRHSSSLDVLAPTECENTHAPAAQVTRARVGLGHSRLKNWTSSSQSLLLQNLDAVEDRTAAEMGAGAGVQSRAQHSGAIDGGVLTPKTAGLASGPFRKKCIKSLGYKSGAIFSG